MWILTEIVDLELWTTLLNKGGKLSVYHQWIYNKIITTKKESNGKIDARGNNEQNKC